MTFSTFWTRVGACATLGLASMAAHAELYTFTITGDYSASWQLDSSISPDEVGIGTGARFYDVAGFPDAALGVADVTFYNASVGGGLTIYDYYGDTDLVASDGPQLYSGLESAPVFLTGSFALTEFQGAGRYTLTVTSVAGAVPEPASLALLLAGLAVVGGAAVRQRRKAAGTVDEAA